MTTLTDFLLARIAEDEADPWRGAELIGSDRAVGRAEHEALAAEERAWEARVLAECEAKRRIVDYRKRVARESEATGVPIFEAQLSAYDATLRALALPYASHPDYRESWKP